MREGGYRRDTCNGWSWKMESFSLGSYGEIETKLPAEFYLLYCIEPDRSFFEHDSGELFALKRWRPEFLIMGQSSDASPSGARRLPVVPVVVGLALGLSGDRKTFIIVFTKVTSLFTNDVIPMMNPRPSSEEAIILHSLFPPLPLQPWRALRWLTPTDRTALFHQTFLNIILKPHNEPWFFQKRARVAKRRPTAFAFCPIADYTVTEEPPGLPFSDSLMRDECSLIPTACGISDFYLASLNPARGRSLRTMGTGLVFN